MSQLDSLRSSICHSPVSDSDHQPKCLSWLKKLISINTVSENSNLEFISICRDELSSLGFICKVFYSECGQKANLLASCGPMHIPGIVLSGHTDVVPVLSQIPDWNSDPFQLLEKDGLLYGRGTCDMKGFIAICMTYAPLIAAHKHELQVPIHFAFSYDEELACSGAQSMIDYIAGKGFIDDSSRDSGESLRISKNTLSPFHEPVSNENLDTFVDQKSPDVMLAKPFGCIVGEPTMMNIVHKHKSACGVSVKVHGQEIHSGYGDRGVNAIEYAAELIQEILCIKREKATQGPFDYDFDPPFTVVNTNIIQGGHAINIIPKNCEFIFEWRGIPSELRNPTCDPDTIHQKGLDYGNDDDDDDDDDLILQRVKNYATSLNEKMKNIQKSYQDENTLTSKEDDFHPFDGPLFSFSKIYQVPSLFCDSSLPENARLLHLIQNIHQTLCTSAYSKAIDADQISNHTKQDIIVSDVKDLSSPIPPPSPLLYEAASFLCEAALFSSVGIPSVVFGPGSIKQAHKPNEYISLEQLIRYEEFFEKLVLSFLHHTNSK